MTRKELLAVVTFVHYFRSYLFGQCFLLRTNHSSLTWLQNFKEPEGQLARWIEKLQEFNFTVIHRQGIKHMNADAMSRKPEQRDHLQIHEEVTECSGEQSSSPPKPSNQGETIKTSPNLEVVSATMVATKLSSADLRHEQLEDDTTGPILRAKEVDGKPDTETMRRYSRATRQLFQLWDQLVIEDGVLH